MCQAEDLIQHYITIPHGAADLHLQKEPSIRDKGTPVWVIVGYCPASSSCVWGLYIDDHQSGGSWESRLFLANIDTQHAHTDEVFMLTTETIRSKSLRLEPNSIVPLNCGDLQACDVAGGLYVQSDTPVLAATLFVINTVFGGGLARRRPRCASLVCPEGLETEQCSSIALPESGAQAVVRLAMPACVDPCGGVAGCVDFGMIILDENCLDSQRQL